MTAHLDTTAYRRAIGDELRRARKRHGWTRDQVRALMPDPVSLQTIATYELGTRHCSVVRLAQLCLALGETPHSLLARVHARIDLVRPGVLRLDLRDVADDMRPELAPLQRWAAERLVTVTTAAGTYVDLDLTALASLAHLCGLDLVTLITMLRDETCRPRHLPAPEGIHACMRRPIRTCTSF